MIHADTWHLRVFLQAYVHDRRWVHVWFSGWDLPPQPDLPEIAVYDEYCRQADATEGRKEELMEAAYEAQGKWVLEQRALSEMEEARKVKERLLTGRMSLCPYFWSVVWALVFYYGLVRSTRPIRKFLGWAVDTLSEPLARAARLAAKPSLWLLLIGAVGGPSYCVYTTWDSPQGIGTEIARMKEERRWEREAKQVREEARRQQEEWKRSHPQEVAQLAREAKEREQEEKRQRSKERATYWRELPGSILRDGKEIGLELLAVAGTLFALGAGIVLAAVLLAGIALTLERLLWPFFYLISIRAKDGGFRQRVSRRWVRFSRILGDTREFLAAFIKAKKERVCPYLEFEINGDQV